MDQPTLATVIEVLSRTGSRGAVQQVKVQFMESTGGQNQQRIVIRNVYGPVQIGDTLSLLETEREARRLR